jgi:pantetheine-phosphate adenylyltransferase
MARIGFYSGTFDPVTLGHTDVIARAAGLVDKLVIGIGVHPGKAPLFDAVERERMLEAEAKVIAKQAGIQIDVVTFDNLVVKAAAEHGATVIFRGLRDASDFDYEMQMAGMNGAMAPGVHTVFLPASPGVRHITGTLVRQISLMGGDVTPFVPSAVAKLLKTKVATSK